MKASSASGVLQRVEETQAIVPASFRVSLSDVSAVRKAMLRLASIYHPDKGGLSEQMVRVNAAYARALRMASITEPGDH